MSYQSQFSGAQIDRAVSAITAEVIQAGLFRAPIGQLASSYASNSIDEISVSPTQVFLKDGDKLTVLNPDTNAIYEMYVRLGDPDDTLDPDSTFIPVGDENGDPVALFAPSGTAVKLEGLSIFDRYSDLEDLSDVQSTRLAQLENHIIGQASTGVLTTITSDLDGDYDQLPVEAIPLDLEDGDRLFITRQDNLSLVAVEVDGNHPEGSQTIQLADTYTIVANSGAPVSFDGQAFMGRFAIGQDRISMLVTQTPQRDRIGLVSSEVDDSTQVPIDDLKVDLRSGDEVYFMDPENFEITEAFLASPTSSGSSVTLTLQSPISLNEGVGLYLPMDFVQGELRSFFEVQAGQILMSTPVFRTPTWTGDVDDDPASDSFGEIQEFMSDQASPEDPAWAITRAAHFEFFQDTDNYFRSKGEGFEFSGDFYHGGHAIVTTETVTPDGRLRANALIRGAQQFDSTIEFEHDSSSPRDTITWGQGDIELSREQNPESWLIEAGSITLQDDDLHYIFFDAGQDSPYELDYGSNLRQIIEDDNKIVLAQVRRGPVIDGQDISASIIPVVGSLHLNGEQIATGSITADNIAANQITATHVQAGSFEGDEFAAWSVITVGDAGDNQIITIDGRTEIDGTPNPWRLYVGHQQGSQAPFRVDQDGVMHSTGGVVEGQFHVGSGSSVDGTLTIVNGEIVSDDFDESSLTGFRLSTTDSTILGDVKVAGEFNITEGQITGSLVLDSDGRIVNDSEEPDFDISAGGISIRSNTQEEGFSERRLEWRRPNDDRTFSIWGYYNDIQDQHIGFIQGVDLLRVNSSGDVIHFFGGDSWEIRDGEGRTPVHIDNDAIQLSGLPLRVPIFSMAPFNQLSPQDGYIVFLSDSGGNDRFLIAFNGIWRELVHKQYT